VQYTKNDWRNRNRIKGPNGAFWLTIPVARDSVRRSIDQVRIPDSKWQRKHLKSLCECYARAKFFPRYLPFFEDIYVKKNWASLSDLNQTLICEISAFLGLKTRFARSSDFRPEGRKTERLLALLKQAGAGRYVSGPSARAYLKEEAFAEAGIDLIYKTYDYPEYPQLWGGFMHEVSIVDMLFNLGPEAPEYIWGRKACGVLAG
jgi:hypothetical protein